MASTAPPASALASGRRRLLATVAVAAAFALGAGGVGAADGDVGYQGPHFSGTGTQVTGAKNESKLWWNDGHWWAVLWDEVDGDNFIYRLDLATQTWVHTGTRADNRAGTRSDVLWDGTKLYVASHGYTNTSGTGFDARLYRYSYDASTDTYTLDAGFPAVISNWKSETLVIDKDSTGQLWATWVGGTSVYVNRTQNGDDRSWGTPFVLPVSGATNVTTDDISSVVAFGGGSVGVMWSNQTTSAMYFAVHRDAEADTVWEASRTAIQGPDEADDHINLKSLQSDGSGRVYAAVKTSHTAAMAPLIRLMVRDPATGDWASHTFGRQHEHHTRPIVLIDEEHRMLYMFATSGESGGTVYMKTTPLDAIAFEEGLGTPFIHDASSDDMNDATSTKQNLNSTTGLVVLASNDSTRYYWHNYLPLGAPGLSASFSASPTAGVRPLTVQFTDGSTGAPTSWAWDFGDGATSTAQHPSHTYTAAGTYTVTLTVTGSDGATSTATRANLVTVENPAPLAADFSGTPTSGYSPLSVQFTDLSTGSPVSWLWSFGDGTTSTAQHPFHIYEATGAYDVSLTVTNATGETSTATRAAYVEVLDAAVALPVEDAFTRSSNATKNYGGETTLRVKHGGSSASAYKYWSYLKFQLPASLATAPASVKLRLWVVDPATRGGVVYLTDNAWSESTITWANAPQPLGEPIGTAGAAPLDSWVEIELDSAAFAAGGTVSLVIVSPSPSDGTAFYSSREGAKPPELILG